MKRKISLIALIIFICIVSSVLVNHVQKKINLQSAQASINKNTVQKQQNNHKDDGKITSTEIPSSSATNTDDKINSANSSGGSNNSSNINDSKNIGKESNLNHVPDSQNSSNLNNKSSGEIKSDVKQAKSSTVTENHEQINFFIIDNVDGSKNYSSTEKINSKSVADVTLEVLNRQGISKRYTSGITGVYFSSINGQSEKSAGEKSGWNYYVNGKKASVGSSNYILKDGDKIQWIFMKDALDN
ncbi:DUF4430 domain-containing protein [Clostridium pasteurianum]|uniref:Transcobalamin-like C-terminal domain-containing protein n=1 Tax=Clostridium pasteurianum BC1 TaxID=86416 RepID=R4K9Y4_CLOPA|nr:DUF4430 domain-containing protein [Clostridium pasteurianum]AGK98491.1 hypothetical protein Clopa_3712 [Clostridium pasteurianum BC1]